MALVLQIENCDRLPDGGPVRIVVGPQGCQVGRAAGLHWVLPDPARHISSHHFDISFAEGGWWLTDRSTNGTFLRGSRYRLEAPHRLAHLDRFQVGHYIIMALIETAAEQAVVIPDPFMAPAPGAAWGAGDPYAAALPEADPWTGGWGGGPDATPLPSAPYPQPVMAPAAPAYSAPYPTPAYPSPPAPHPSGMGRREDFADEFIAAPVFHTAPVSQIPEPAPVQPVPVMPQPVMPDPVAPLPVAELPPAPYPTMAARPEPEVSAQPPHLSRPPVLAEAAPSGLSQPPRDLAVSLPPVHPSAAPVQAPAPSAPGGDAVLAAFCAGAGLEAAAFAGADAATLAHALGRSLRMTSAEVMTQLQLRAAAKQFTKGGERTMRQAAHNNPLKFLPDVEQALEAMFLRPRAGFLQGPEALAEALLDLRRHQVALFAALQPALGALLGDLAPEEVEKAGGGGGLLGGSRKAKAWETFVERWDAKSAPHENGMLDEFLRHFAAAYQESVAAQGGGGQA